MLTGIRRPADPEEQYLDLPDAGGEPRELDDRAAPAQDVPEPDAGYGDTPTGTMPTLAQAFPPLPKSPGRARMNPEPEYFADAFPDRTPAGQRPNVSGFDDVERLVSRPASSPAKMGSTPFEPEYLDKNPPTQYAAIGDSPRSDGSGGTNRVVARLPATVEKPPIPNPDRRGSNDYPRPPGAGGDLPVPNDLFPDPDELPVPNDLFPDPDAPASTPISLRPRAPASAPGASPVSAPVPEAAPSKFSQYAALERAFKGGEDAPVNDLSWASRLAAKAVNMGRPDRKPDFGMAEDNARAVAYAQGAPDRRLRQQILLANAQEEDRKRANAPINELLDRRLKVAQINKAEREPQEKPPTWQVKIIEDLNSPDPAVRATAEKFLRLQPSVQSAGINSASRERITDKKNDAQLRVKELQIAFNEAEGDRKRELARELAAAKNELQRYDIDTDAAVADKRITESQNKERRARQVALGKATAPLAEGYNALKQITERYPVILDGTAPDAVPNWLERAASKAPGGVASRLLDKNSQEFKLMVDDLRMIMQQARSGAAVSEDEAKRYEAQFGGRIFDDPQFVANAINWYGAKIAEKLRATQAAYDDVLDGYADYGAPTYKSEWLQPFFRKLTPAGAATDNVEPTPAGVVGAVTEAAAPVVPRGRLEVPARPQNPTGLPEDEPILMRRPDMTYFWKMRKNAAAEYKKGATFALPKDEQDIIAAAAGAGG